MTPALLLAALTATSPMQDQSCAVNLDEMVSQLAEHYGERPLGGGLELTGKGALLFVIQARGTWTVVYFAGADAPACIVGAGTDWRFSPIGEAL